MAQGLATTMTTRVPPSAARVLLGATPVAVGAAMALGYLVIASLGTPVFGREMLAAGAVALVAGWASSVPLLLAMRSGNGAKMPTAALLGAGLRVLLMLTGTLLLLGPGFGLARFPAVLWALGFYLPLLAADTAVVAWVLRSLDGK